MDQRHPAGMPPWGPRPGAGPPMQQGQPMRPGGPGPPGPQWMPQAPPQMGGPGAGPPGPQGQPGQPWNRGPPPQGMPRPAFPGGQGPPHPGQGPPFPGHPGQGAPHPGFAPPQRPLFPGGMAQAPARPDMFRPPPQQQGFAGPPGPGGMPPAQMLQQQPARPFGGPGGQVPGGQLPGTPVTPVTPAAEASPRTQPKSAWTEHTAPDGRKYYYNAATKTSSWTRPPELSQPQAQAPAAAAPEKKPEVQSDWKEFTAPDGRKYYYNRVTKQSKWQMPDELKAAAGAAGGKTPPPKGSTPVQVVKLESQSPSAAPASNGVLAGNVSQDRKPEASLPEPKRAVVYSSKEEAKEAFKELLASVGTASNATWDTTMRLIANDPRFSAFRTIGEKKACFNEYLQQRSKEEREEARLRAKRIRDDFATLLELSPELRTGMRYSKAAALFDDEPRWQAVKDAREREQLFNEHMKERERKEKEARRAEARRRKAAFRSLLEATRSIKVDTTWRKAQTKLEGEEEYEALDKLDRLEVFQGHIKELEKRERAEREAEKEARRRAERKARDAFRALLRSHAEDGTITPKMRWKDYHDIVQAEEAFRTVAANLSGSRPRELFEDALEGVEEGYLRSRARLRDAAKEAPLRPDSSFDAFSASVDAAGEADRELAAVPLAHRQLFFDEEMGALAERAAKEAKRRRRAREDFLQLLSETRRIKHDTPWVEAQPMLEKEPEFRALEAADREALFTEYIEKLAAKRKEREAAEEEEEKRGREAKKARRSDEDGKGKKEKKEKRHKKEKHKDEKDKERDKDKEERGAKRKSADSDEEKKSSKRRKKERGDGKGGDSAEEGEL